MLNRIKHNIPIVSKSVLSIAFILNIMISCQEPFLNENLDANQQIPVFNGTLTNIENINSFNLYYAMPYTSQNKQNIEGAIITINDELGSTIQLQETSQGIYKLPDNYNLAYHNSYTTTIQMPNGEILKSQPCYFNDTIPIDEIFFDFNLRTTIVKNSNGDYSEVTEEGIFIKTKLQQPTNQPYYYRSTTNYYVHSEMWKNRVKDYIILEDDWEIQYKIHYDTLYDVYEGVANSNFSIFGELQAHINYSHNDLINSPLFLIADNECRDFSRYTSNKFIEWVVPIDIYRCSKDVFDYYTEAAEQLEANGQLFDPIPDQITGNMYNESNAMKPVLGLFDATAVNRKYLSVYVHEALGYRSYQSRILIDTIIKSGEYPRRYSVDTVFVDSIPVIN